ncbi:Sodium/hydrogen exchanger 8 [Araneus ventricosus]|uniref:Sodium/hydrogen exchanger 8 n=1 Tax=Araneus ventricosus TaxID=182803 RepID=A0A4Y2KYX1_ARAVE|nr:Sodium/hydrogen exchanger 8 [Araneus ventricosus]
MKPKVARPRTGVRGARLVPDDPGGPQKLFEVHPNAKPKVKLRLWVGLGPQNILRLCSHTPNSATVPTLGNFFRNIGSILVFAILGTAVSAFTIGGSLFLLGKKQWVYELSFTESFALGSFLSAVDPVATLAVFHALDVDPVLNMLVIGESILNDAVAIVLSGTVWEASKNPNIFDHPISRTILQCAVRFTTIFCASAAIGVVFGLIAALISF